MAIINLLLSIKLCQTYGAIGSAIGTSISLLLANGIIINIYYYRSCGIDILLFWKNIFRLSFGLVMPIIVGIIFSLFVRSDSVICMFIKIIVLAIIYFISMWCFGINKDEKLLFINPICYILKKLQKRKKA